MNIICVSTGSYPDIHAASIRQSVLMKGMAELGHNVRFLVLNPQDWGSTQLNYHGVQFEELVSYRGANKYLGHYHYLKGVHKAKKIIRGQKQAGKVDAVVVFSVMAIHTYPIYWLIKSIKAAGVPVFHERTELPYAFDVNKHMLNAYLHKMLPLFNGIFVISNKLITYIKQFNKEVTKLLTVVDLNFFTTDKASPYNFPYVGYCGTISGNKDGVPILIEAFASIAPQFPDHKLVLIGNNNPNAIRDTLEKIEQLGITDKVVFTGLVEREMMPVLMCNAEILVVSKPDNEQNSGNFPIKIGEYLATGVPVVVTSVGEIPVFVKDGDTGFVSAPDSAPAFAAKMKEALADPARAKAIGARGQKVAQSLFDYKIQATEMARYIAAQIGQS